MFGELIGFYRNVFKTLKFLIISLLIEFVEELFIVLLDLRLDENNC